MLFAVIGLLGGCGGDENDPVDPWEPVSIVGQWKQVMVERYAPDGMLLEQLRLDADEQDIVIFNEAGFYRYFDCLDWGEYEGAYAYNRFTRQLQMETSDLHYISVAASYNTAADDYFYGQMRWIYGADESGSRKVEYYVPSEQQLPTPPEKEEDITDYFPDEDFRNYMIDYFDIDGDRRISIAEAARIETIDLRNITVASLEGVEYCTALTNLDCSGNQLTALDVSRNTKLEYLICYGNQLSTLDISQNTALTGLVCYNNQLTTLDVSNCKQLKWLYLNPMPSLQTLYMERGQTIETMSIPQTTQIIYK